MDNLRITADLARYFQTAAGPVTVTETPSIPMGCVCAYTWAGIPGRLVRNGALSSCTADHAGHGV
jgi:hypothetical protein